MYAAATIGCALIMYVVVGTLYASGLYPIGAWLLAKFARDRYLTPTDRRLGVAVLMWPIEIVFGMLLILVIALGTGVGALAAVLGRFVKRIAPHVAAK